MDEHVSRLAAGDFWREVVQTSGTPGGATEGNRLTLYTDGQEAFQASFEAISRARERVWLETYILEPDEVGQQAIDGLAEAARRGCDVILLFDRWGSPHIGTTHAAPIQAAGGRVAVYNPVLPWQKLGRKTFSMLHRDHRKILVADDVAFCGGRNISADYGGGVEARFYDLTLRLEGPCVRDLASVLLDSLRAATGRTPQLPPRPAPLAGGVFVNVLELNYRKHQRDLDVALHRALEKAQQRCWLTTPYFIPPAWFQKALMRAAQRGVDVRVLTAGESDVPLARVAGRHLYGRLLSFGARVFEMLHPTLHAKNIVIDGCYSIIGSYNVDRYGSRHNLEVGVAAADPALAEQLEAQFLGNLERSEEVELEAWERRPLHRRLGQWFVYRLAGL